VSFINLVKDRNKWSGLVSTVMKLQIPLTFWEFLDKVRNYQRLKKEPASERKTFGQSFKLQTLYSMESQVTEVNNEWHGPWHILI
jgi:hypothetical protein